MFQKNYFNHQKKINSNFFKDFNFISFNIEKSVLSKINNYVVDLFNYNESKNFKNIYQVQKFLNKTEFYSLKRNLNTMVKLEKIICNYFSKIKILNKSVKGIQFPMDIRIAHPYKPNQLKNKKYLTTSIHCDNWTEEPSDIINCILYLVVNKNTPKIDILQSNEKDIIKYSKYANSYKNKFFLNSKKYFSILNELKNKKLLQINHTHGQVMIFNGFVPHQTSREGNEVRLSLEFRFRTKNPYKNVNQWSKNNNHARYWFLPNGIEIDFFQRLKFEYFKIKKLKKYKQLINLRNNEIEKNLIFKNS